MPAKTYGQPCPIARSLDVLGDRWTLLMIRELLLGPKRFKDFLTAFPAIGPNRLSARLSLLLANCVIQQTVDRKPAAYELTEYGERLRGPLMALGQWGLALPQPEDGEMSKLRAELIALTLTGAMEPSGLPDPQNVYEFEIGDEVFHIYAEDDCVVTKSGPAQVPATVSFASDIETFMALILQKMDIDQALEQKRAAISQGKAEAARQLFEVLEYHGEVPAFEES